MKSVYNDFRLFAKDKGVSGTGLDDYMKKTHPLAITSLNQGARIMDRGEGYISPTIIEERQLNVAQMDVFSRLIMDRIIFLGSEINELVSDIVEAQILYLDSTDTGQDINLYINSYGGIVDSGYAIYDVMHYVSSDVSTLCKGCCASMAAIILAGGTKGKRYIMPHSRVMIHQPLGGIHGQASDIEITANEILRTKKEIYQTLANDTGKSYEEIEANADRDKWFRADEAIEFGLVDSIIECQRKLFQQYK